jgi:hypothetical protein
LYKGAVKYVAGRPELLRIKTDLEIAEVILELVVGVGFGVAAAGKYRKQSDCSFSLECFDVARIRETIYFE